MFTPWCQCFWLWLSKAPPPAKTRTLFQVRVFIISECYEELMSLWTGIVPENTGRERRTIWTNWRFATSHWKERMRCWRLSCSAWGQAAYIWHQGLHSYHLNCTAFYIPLWSISSFGCIKIYKLIVCGGLFFFLWRFVHAVCWQKSNVQRKSAHQGLATFVFYVIPLQKSWCKHIISAFITHPLLYSM